MNNEVKAYGNKCIMPNNGYFGAISITKDEFDKIETVGIANINISIFRSYPSQVEELTPHLLITERVGEMILCFKTKDELKMNYRIGEALECYTNTHPSEKYEKLFVRVVGFGIKKLEDGFDRIFVVEKITEDEALSIHQIDPNNWEWFGNVKEMTKLDFSKESVFMMGQNDLMEEYIDLLIINRSLI